MSGTLSEATQSHQVSAKGGVVSTDEVVSEDSPPSAPAQPTFKPRGGGFADGVRAHHFTSAFIATRSPACARGCVRGPHARVRALKSTHAQTHTCARAHTRITLMHSLTQVIYTTVKDGETLGESAAAIGCPVEDLYAQNVSRYHGLKVTSRLEKGTVLM